MIYNMMNCFLRCLNWIKNIIANFLNPSRSNQSNTYDEEVTENLLSGSNSSIYTIDIENDGNPTTVSSPLSRSSPVSVAYNKELFNLNKTECELKPESPLSELNNDICTIDIHHRNEELTPEGLSEKSTIVKHVMTESYSTVEDAIIEESKADTPSIASSLLLDNDINNNSNYSPLSENSNPSASLVDGGIRNASNIVDAESSSDSKVNSHLMLIKDSELRPENLSIELKNDELKNDVCAIDIKNVANLTTLTSIISQSAPACVLDPLPSPTAAKSFSTDNKELSKMKQNEVDYSAPESLPMELHNDTNTIDILPLKDDTETTVLFEASVNAGITDTSMNVTNVMADESYSTDEDRIIEESKEDAPLITTSLLRDCNTNNDTSASTLSEDYNPSTSLVDGGLTIVSNIVDATLSSESNVCSDLTLNKSSESNRSTPVRIRGRRKNRCRTINDRDSRYITPSPIRMPFPEGPPPSIETLEFQRSVEDAVREQVIVVDTIQSNRSLPSDRTEVTTESSSEALVYINQIDDSLRVLETNYQIYRERDWNDFQSLEICQKRAEMIDWMMKIFLFSGFEIDSTIFLAVSILDRYVTSIDKAIDNSHGLKEIAEVALFLAVKVLETDYDQWMWEEFDEWSMIDQSEFLSRERDILLHLNAECHVATAYVFVDRYINEMFETLSDRDSIHRCAVVVLKRSLLDHSTTRDYAPSLLAAAALITAFNSPKLLKKIKLSEELKNSPLLIWNKHLVKYTGYSKEIVGDCAKLLMNLVQTPVYFNGKDAVLSSDVGEVFGIVWLPPSITETSIEVIATTSSADTTPNHIPSSGPSIESSWSNIHNNHDPSNVSTNFGVPGNVIGATTSSSINNFGGFSNSDDIPSRTSFNGSLWSNNHNNNNNPSNVSTNFGVPGNVIGATTSDSNNNFGGFFNSDDIPSRTSFNGSLWSNIHNNNNPSNVSTSFGVPGNVIGATTSDSNNNFGGFSNSDDIPSRTSFNGSLWSNNHNNNNNPSNVSTNFGVPGNVIGATTSDSNNNFGGFSNSDDIPSRTSFNGSLWSNNHNNNNDPSNVSTSFDIPGNAIGATTSDFNNNFGGFSNSDDIPSRTSFNGSSLISK